MKSHALHGSAWTGADVRAKQPAFVRMVSQPTRAPSWVPLATGLTSLALVVAIALFLDLGRPDFWDPGEGRYAETVREMLLTGNWLVPTLNFVHYYDKPPGFYWLVAASFELFGAHEWAARLPAAVAAAVTVLATVLFAWRRLGRGVALGAGMILATAIQFVVLARSVRMDTWLTLAVSGTLFAAWRIWERDETDEVGAAPLATWPLYLLAAIGVLVKGPVAIVLPALILGVLAILTRDPQRLWRMRPGPGALVAVAVAGTWYLAAAIYAPEFLWTFLWHHNVERFVAGETGHGRSLFFFLWILPITFLPWTLFLPHALGRAWRAARARHDLELFLLVWVGVVVVFFTLSRAKLPTYMLPAFPALALLVASHVAHALAEDERARERAFKIPAVLWAIGMVVGAVGVPVAVGLRYPAHVLQAGSALVLLVFPVAGVVILRSRRWSAVPVLVLLSALAIEAIFYRVGAPVVNEFASLRAAADVAQDLPIDAPVFAYKTRGHSFTFYGGRTITRVRSPEAAAAALARQEPVGLLTKAKYVERIQHYLADPVCIWWQGPSGRLLLVNRASPYVRGRAESRAILPPQWSTHAKVSATRPPRC